MPDRSTYSTISKKGPLKPEFAGITKKFAKEASAHRHLHNPTKEQREYDEAVAFVEDEYEKVKEAIDGPGGWTDYGFHKLFPLNSCPRIEVRNKKTKKYVEQAARPAQWHPKINWDIYNFAVAGAEPHQLWEYVKPEMEKRLAGDGDYATYKHVNGIIFHDTFAGLSRFRREKLEVLQAAARAQAEKADKEKLEEDVQKMRAMMADMKMEKKKRLEEELEMLRISN